MSKAVYNIIDGENGGQAKWVRIGTAFVNKDGSINALLDTYPSEGKIHIRDNKYKGKNENENENNNE